MDLQAIREQLKVIEDAQVRRPRAEIQKVGLCHDPLRPRVLPGLPACPWPCQSKNLVELEAIDIERRARLQQSRDRVAKAIASDQSGHLAKGLDWDQKQEEEKAELADR